MLSHLQQCEFGYAFNHDLENVSVPSILRHPALFSTKIWRKWACRAAFSSANFATLSTMAWWA